MGKGYAEGPAMEEHEAALERGRQAVYGATDEDPESHFLGWLDDVDPDTLFASGAAWGLKIVRRSQPAQ